MEFLRVAIDQGIRLFDTAPSYGSSEQRLGRIVRELSPELQQELILATKFGEHWDDSRDQPYIDHGYDKLVKSFDNSLEILGRIDLLQLHLATKENVLSSDVVRAFEHAKSSGVPFIGASVKDMDTAILACDSGLYDVLQFPLNTLNQDMKPVIGLAGRKGLKMLINRPLSSGGLASEGGGTTKIERMQASFKFLTKACPDASILLGTKSVAHLHENLAALQ